VIGIAVDEVTLVNDIDRMGRLSLHVAKVARRRHPNHALPEEVRTGTHELYLTTQGDRALVLTANIYADYYTEGEFHDFSIVDVSDPTDPVELYNWDPRELVAAEDFNGLYYTDEEGASRTAFAHSVITDTRGHFAYISYWDLGTIIMDIRNPENPKVVGHTSFEREVQGAAHSAALARGGNILIETREVFNPDPADPEFERGWGYTRIYDIRDKSNPKLIGDFRTDNSMEQIDPETRRPGTYTVHDPKVRGNTLYLSHYSDGVRMVDISDPSNPKEIASYVPDGANVWGVYLDRRYIYGSDMGSGLKVLEVTTPQQAQRESVLESFVGEHVAATGMLAQRRAAFDQVYSVHY
jgi:hypothetical protein